MYQFSCCICGAVFERVRIGRSLKKYCSNACVGKANGLREKGFANPSHGLKMRQILRERQTPNFDLPIEKLQYIAGFLDAEGTLLSNPFVGLYNTNYSTLATIRGWLNFGKVYERSMTDHFMNGHFGHKPMFMWYSGSRQLCTELLETLLPYLCVKRDKAIAVLGHSRDSAPMSWAYVAAFFDGEGSVSFYDDSGPTSPNSQYYKFDITNTHLETLNTIQRFLDYGKVYVRENKHLDGKPVGTLRVGRYEDQIAFCGGITRYLLIKNEKVAAAADWIKAKDWNADNKLRHVTDEEVIRKYGEVQSIRKVAAQYGVGYNSMRERLLKAGAKLRLPDGVIRPINRVCLVAPQTI